jgi:hypothetical protein
MLVASPRFEPEPCRIAIVRCEAKAWDARDRPARGDSLAVTRESAAPACGRRHRSSARLAGADPLCWRYAECEILAILAQFRELRLGSGPRNRVHVTSSRNLKTSGSSEAWYRARFGTERSRVRIPPSRPLTKDPTSPRGRYPPESIQARRTKHLTSSRNCELSASLASTRALRFWKSLEVPPARKRRSRSSKRRS